MKRILCKLTGGHRFQGAPDTFIDKHEIVHYRHTCIKCGKMCEYCVPWINVWHGVDGYIKEGNKNGK